jgi:hypothetical protein
MFEVVQAATRKPIYGAAAMFGSGIAGVPTGSPTLPNLTWDLELWDSGAYYADPAASFVVPSGKGGYHYLSAEFNLSTDDSVSAWRKFTFQFWKNSAALSHAASVVFCNDGVAWGGGASTYGVRGYISTIANLIAGDSVGIQIKSDGTLDITLYATMSIIRYPD